ncbi:MAG: hypothetical protein DRI57_05320 [Deltaproteobacteria bacterium]|nr:MAG: hypothetical protein DRI57_05320 [Deltaproteobacteria bacterium]
MSSNNELRIPCIVYARVVGYYRPTFTWNDGRVAEWEERQLIDVNDIIGRTNPLLSRESANVNTARAER